MRAQRADRDRTEHSAGTGTRARPAGQSPKDANTLWHAVAWVLIAVLGLAALAAPASAATATRTSSFAYDTNTGLLAQEVTEPGTAALKLQTDYAHDAFGNAVTVTTSGADITTRSASASYDTKGQFATSNANALNQSESWTYDARFGVPLTHTGPNGLTTSWTYDTIGRLTQETRPDGTKTNYTYSYCSGVNGGSAACPQYGTYLVQAIPYAADGTTQNGPWVKSYYDGLERVIATDTQGFDGAIIRVETQYDAKGRVLKTSRPYFLSGGTPKYTTVTAYDDLGRATQVTAPDNSQTNMAFHGLTTAVTNDLNQTTTTVRNERGETVQVTDAAGNSTSYIYDPFGNLLQTTDPAGNVITSSYDIRGRKTASTDPDMGSWSYAYDTLSELTSQTDAKSQTTSLTYDKLGRVTQRVEADLTSNWTYDSCSYGIGKLCQSTASNGYQMVVGYDALARPLTTATTIDGVTASSSASYDANGHIAGVVYPSGFAVTYSYTALGYQSQLKDASSASVFWTANARDAELHLIQETAGNGLVTNAGFNANTGLVQSVQAGAGNAAANLSFSFDTIGNLTARSDATQSLSEAFTYDALNRLTQTQIAGGATKSVSYDAIGNITSKSDTGAYAYAAPGGALPHAVAAITPSGTGTLNTTYAYDANGNMSAGGGRSTSWTAANMVAQITQGASTVTFAYGPEHARIKQVTASATTYYFSDAASGVSFEKVLGTGGTTQWNEYLIADGKMAGEHYTLISASLVTTTKTRYFTGDHLGSIAVITDESAAIVERLSYDAWGKRRFANGADDPAGSITSQTTRGFTGHEMIDQVGLINMNGRIQDPALGKFLSADPTIQNPGDSQSFNRYSYVQNRPLSATDPTGFKPNGQSAGFGDGLETIRSTLETERWIRSQGLTPCDYACQFAASGSGGVYSSGPLITSGGAIISGFTGNVIGSIFSDIGINLPGEVAGYGGPSGGGYGGYDAKAASSQTTGTTGGGARAAGGSSENHTDPVIDRSSLGCPQCAKHNAHYEDSADPNEVVLVADRDPNAFWHTSGALNTLAAITLGPGLVFASIADVPEVLGVAGIARSGEIAASEAAGSVGEELVGASVKIYRTAKGLERSERLIQTAAGPGKRNSSFDPSTDAQTGRGPRNLKEQLSIDAAKATPNAGKTLPIVLRDARWPASSGWVKMEQVFETGDGQITVHYNYNNITGDIADAKITFP